MHDDDDDGKKNVKNSSAISGSVAILFFNVLEFAYNSQNSFLESPINYHQKLILAWEIFYANRIWSHDNENFELQIILWLMPLKSLFTSNMDIRERHLRSG